MRTLVGLGVALSIGCSAGNDKDPIPPRDGSVVDAAEDLAVSLDTTPTDGACAAVTHTATQAPASIMFVLDASDSMANGGKWSAAALAIVTAIDQDAFDSMSLGLLASPNGTVTGPACVAGFPVACGSPALPAPRQRPTRR